MGSLGLQALFQWHSGGWMREEEEVVVQQQYNDDPQVFTNT